MAKGMRTKDYSIKKVAEGYSVTFKGGDYFAKGTVVIPLDLLSRPRGYDAMDKIEKFTTYHYAEVIKDAMMAHAGIKDSQW